MLPIRDNLKAISFGWLFYVLGNISYYIIIGTVGSNFGYLNYMLYFVAFAGGFITGRFSTKNPVFNLIVVGVLMGLSAGIINYLYGLLGFPTDFGSFKGFQILVAFAIPLFVVLSLFGGALGSKDESK